MQTVLQRLTKENRLLAGTKRKAKSDYSTETLNKSLLVVTDDGHRHWVNISEIIYRRNVYSRQCKIKIVGKLKL